MIQSNLFKINFRKSKLRFHTVRDYFEEYDNQLTVTFKPRIPNEKLRDVELLMSRKFTYPQVVSLLGAQLQVDPNFILISQPGAGSQKIPILSSNTMALAEMIGMQFYPHLMNTIFYEILPMTIQEYESKTYVRASYLDSSTKEQGPFDLFVLRESNLELVAHELLKCIKREENGSGKLRILEVINHKIYKHCDLTEPLQNIPSHSNIYVEVISLIFKKNRKYQQMNLNVIQKIESYLCIISIAIHFVLMEYHFILY